MLWQITRAGVALLGLYFIGVGLLEWGNSVPGTLRLSSGELAEPLPLGISQVLDILRSTWSAFVIPSAFGLLLVVLSGPIAFLLVPTDAERLHVGLSELLSLGVSLMGLYILFSGLARAASIASSMLFWLSRASEVHPSHFVPHLLGDLGRVVVGFLVVKNAGRIARWI